MAAHRNSTLDEPRPPQRGTDRLTVSRLARQAKAGIVSVGTAAGVLGMSTRAAALKLASLARRGWLERARRGLYLIVPLEAELGKKAVAEDPWVLAQEVFAPCYIGGWSAAEHWGMTEQIFRSILVVTAAHVRSKTATLLGSEFRLFRVPKNSMAGVGTIWRGASKVAVSSRERTLADCLKNPELCGGVRTLYAMLREYAAKTEFDASKLIAEVERANSGAAWKRFGYLAELLGSAYQVLATRAASELSEGYIKLDPSVKTKGHLLRRWRLWVNVRLASNENDEV